MASTGNRDEKILSQSAGDFLIAEYNYIAQTAFQANEDRARVSQFFFVTFATFIAAILSSQMEGVDTQQVYTAFSIAFILVSALGALTLLQLARLRLAWIESVAAMNQIKSAYLERYPELRPAIRWTAETPPPSFKVFSVGFILAIMVGALSGLSAGSSIAIFSLARGAQSVPWATTITLGLAIGAFQVSIFYWLLLKRYRN